MGAVSFFAGSWAVDGSVAERNNAPAAAVNMMAFMFSSLSFVRQAADHGSRANSLPRAMPARGSSRTWSTLLRTCLQFGSADNRSCDISVSALTGNSRRAKGTCVYARGLVCRAGTRLDPCGVCAHGHQLVAVPRSLRCRVTTERIAGENQNFMGVDSSPPLE